MRRIISSILAAFVLCATAQGAASYSFEGAVPQQVKVRGRGETSISASRFKDGSESLKFSWTGQAELLIIDQAAIGESMKNPQNGIMFWLCCDSPIDAPVKVSIKDERGGELCWFNINASFTGWRAVWVKYIDMHVGDGWYGDLDKQDRPTGVAMLSIRPSAHSISGAVYIDRLTFSTKALNQQITPDRQIPDNNHFLTRRNMWHWARLWEWEQTERPAPRELTAEGTASLATVEKQLDKYYHDEIPASGTYNAVKFRPKLEEMYSALNLRRGEDGVVTGRPIVSNDESGKEDVRMQKVFDVMYRYALDYIHTSDSKALERFFMVGDHLIEQGVCYGSGMGTNHHFGYNIRGWSNSLWLMRSEITQAGRMEEYLAALEYWSGLQECRKEFEYGRDEIVDSWNTLLIPKLTAAMLQPTEEERYERMCELAAHVSSSLYFTPGTVGGIKTDGTAFHHGGHYPAYAVGGFSTLGSYLQIVMDSEFVPTEEARNVLKKGLMAMRTYCNRLDWGIGISGRHPFGGRMPAKTIEAFGQLAICGDLSGSGKSCDPELGGAFLALGGKDKEVSSRLKKAGIKAAAAPEGFFTYNYGAFGIHRRDGWMVTLKGYNSDVWGSEIYVKDNRYGRYQSYGSVEVINSGKPASAEDSGMVEEGWNWNRMPGTTAINLPFEMLNSPLKGTLMEKNTSRFPGVSSLEGRNGVLAFTYTEKNRENFCPGATATKSVFCFDNRIIFIGTGISNDSSYPTETTLFQQNITDSGSALIADGALVKGAPSRWAHKGKGIAVIEDLKGNCFIVKSPESVSLTIEQQTSPDNTNKKSGTGTFASAYISHGTAPQDASYEYMMIVEASSSEISKYTKKLPYEVIQADSDAHVVRDRATGITAYISYKGYSSDKTAVSSIPAETIVMERMREDGKRVISICTPDLGLTEKTFTTPQESQPLAREITVDGRTLSVECRHGLPIEIEI